MISGTLSLPSTPSPLIVFVTEATIFIIFIASLIFSPLDSACPNVTFHQLTMMKSFMAVKAVHPMDYSHSTSHLQQGSSCFHSVEWSSSKTPFWDSVF